MDDSFKLFWELQDYFVCLWANILIYGAGLCLFSLQNNNISSDNLQYAFTILIAFLVILAYSFYFAIKVKNHLDTELYKVNNLFRIMGLLLLALGYNNGLLLINFTEIIFFVVDIMYYRSEKYNIFLTSVERICFWVAFNATLLKVTHVPLLVLAGFGFTIITAIKIYYFGKVIMELCS